ncbi:MAG: hypothetical protein HKO65_04215 [Gemmatimonadetes bacterium]|nr:hypothetical protein [Gemmatimonadota bacterium]
MSILETLHLRMAGDDLNAIVDLVRRAAGVPGGLQSVAIYRHSKIEGDLLIHLVGDDPKREDVPSELGLGLASLLRGQGLVEHSVWVRAEPCAGGNQAVVQKENRP